MKRWTLIAGVVVAAIILAVLLVRSPDTGAPPPAVSDRTPGRVVADAEGRPGPPGAEPGRLRPGVGPDGRAMPILKNGPSPVALENIRRMNVPDSLYAGRLTSPLAVVRRQLQLTGDPAAEAIGAKADVLIGQLREQRRDPQAHPLPDLIAQSRAWLDEVKASQWGASPEIEPQFGRFDQIVSEYEQAKANPDQMPPPPGGAPEPPSTEGE